MRSKHSPRRRLVAASVVTALIVTACGGDDDTSDTSDEATSDTSDNSDEATSGTSDVTCGTSRNADRGFQSESTADSADGETSATDPSTTSNGTESAPSWAYNPDEVRTLTFPECEGFDVRSAGSETGAITDEGPCAYRTGLLAVYVPDGIDTVTIESEAARIGVRLTSSGGEQPFGSFVFETESGVDPLEAAVALRGQGLFASPVYLAGPMPARMFFPGTIPVPVEAAAAAATDLPALDGVEIIIVDTGAGPGQIGRGANDADVEPAGSGEVVSPWSFGHGAFIEQVIRQRVDVTDEQGLTHIRVDPASKVLADEIDLSAALMRIPGEVDDNDQIIVNMSFGVYPCYVDGAPILPVISTAAFAHKFVGPSDSSDASDFGVTASPAAVIVAAAGNSNDDRLTVPAAFAGQVDWADLLPSSSTDESGLRDAMKASFGRLTDRLGQLRSRTIAVTAGPAFDPPESIEPQPAGRQPRPYGSTGAWVTTVAEGCHVAPYRGGTIAYPREPKSSTTIEIAIEQGDPVYWCGTSFAAPIVAVEAALQLSGIDEPGLRGEAIVDLKAGLPLPAQT
jgi:hypothetical protein